MPEETVTSTGEPVAPEPSVTPAVTGAGDRPIENLAGEMNRKFAQMKAQMDALQQYLAQQQAQSQPVPTGDKPATREELWEMAKTGNRNAFDLYMEQIAEQKLQSQFQSVNKAQRVEQQLNVLAQRYPVLNDNSHPLAQAAAAAYQAMVQSGEPASRATLLDAVKLAIADRPDLVSQVYAQQTGGDAARVSATQRAKAGQTGGMSRNAPTPPPAAKLGDKEKELAKRMGIADPDKAIERFHKRQEDGISKLGAVIAHVREE